MLGLEQLGASRQSHVCRGELGEPGRAALPSDTPLTPTMLQALPCALCIDADGVAVQCRPLQELQRAAHAVTCQSFHSYAALPAPAHVLLGAATVLAGPCTDLLARSPEARRSAARRTRGWPRRPCQELRSQRRHPASTRPAGSATGADASASLVLLGPPACLASREHPAQGGRAGTAPSSPLSKRQELPRKAKIGDFGVSATSAARG